MLSCHVPKLTPRCELNTSDWESVTDRKLKRGSGRLRGDTIDGRTVWEDPEAMQRRIREEKRALQKIVTAEVPATAVRHWNTFRY